MNAIGAEGGNAEICAGRALPWLQDLVDTDLRGAWGAANDEVWLLDEANRPVVVYDVGAHDLGIPANYAQLRDLLVEAASCT